MSENADKWTPDRPLSRQAKERFAQLVARGSGQAAAYRSISTRQIGEATARSSAHRWAKEPQVAARIEWLRKHELSSRDSTPEEMTPARLLNLMGTATAALEEAIAALEIAGGSPTAVSKMRSELVTHVSRIHRLEPVKEQPAFSDDDHVGRGIANLHLCACPARRSAR